MDNPLISVIIPTFNRAELLRASLQSLASQSLGTDRFEVVVVDDGSTDATRNVCLDLAGRLRLRYFRIENSGISAAKNLGIFASTGTILLFFDDDDLAHPRLLREHLQTHREHPEETVAVLGYTQWAPSLSVTELMHFVTEVGCFLFSYPHLRDGQSLDFTYFWGGRSSCKRSLLVRCGVFNQQFRFGAEDIELGYRLSRSGLKVIFNRGAVQYMNRAITYEEFCRRCEKQGASQFRFSQLHSDPLIRQYCQVDNARERWNRTKKELGMAFFRVREIESLLDRDSCSADAAALRSELHSLYGWTFDGFKAKGIVQGEDETSPAAICPAPPAPTVEPIVEPIVIFQMGKVGSKTIENSLAALDLGVPICHSHLLSGLDRIEERTRRTRNDPRETLSEIQHGRRLVKTLLGTPYIRCRVISLVRDPVARNISAFFQNITEFLPDILDRFANRELPVAELHTAFLNRYDHDIPATWFQRQLQPVFGIDVFASEFPKERGYAVYAAEDASLLVIKLEMLDDCAADAMRDYLGIHDFVLTNANLGEDKDYKDLYKAFLSSIALPDDYLNRIYESPFARHFYTDLELQQFRARWSTGSAAPANKPRNVVPPPPADVDVRNLSYDEQRSAFLRAGPESAISQNH